MAFNTKEQEIIRWGVSNGKSQQEITDALSRFRTTGSPKAPAIKPQVAPDSDIGSTIADAASAGISKIKQGFEQSRSGTSLVSPIEAGLKVGAGTVETALSPLAPIFKPLADAMKFVTDRIGGMKGVQDFANSKAGEVTSRVAEDVADLSTIAGTVSGGIGTPKVASAVGRIAAETADSLVGIAQKGTEGITAATSKALDPSKIMQRVARIPKAKQADFEKQAGQSVGSYLVDRGIFGDIDEITTQLFQNFEKARNTADDALAKLPGTFKERSVETALNDLFARETRVSSPGALSKDFQRVRQLQQKYDTEGLTMSEINEVKRLYERNIRVDYLKENKPESVAKATSLDTALREWQRAQAKKLGLKNLEDINRETRLAKQLLDDLGREYAGSAGNNAINLTDWIILSGLDPTAIGTFIAKKTLSSNKVMSGIAKKLSGGTKQTEPFPIFDTTGSRIDSYADWIKSIEDQTKP